VEKGLKVAVFTVDN